METVIDPGPIKYQDIELYQDHDLEQALEQNGLDPANTTYRLIEIPLSAIADTKTMPWNHMGTGMIDALRAGAEFPPVVVLATQSGWTLLDGVNRTYAHWTLGCPTIRAYELLT